MGTDGGHLRSPKSWHFALQSVQRPMPNPAFQRTFAKMPAKAAELYVRPHMAKPASSPMLASVRLSRASIALAIVLRHLTQRRYSPRHHG